jgi:hypothetical protein
VHAISADGPTVLTERTDVLKLGQLRVQLWVCGRFDVHDGQIALWRDYFDWLNGTLATMRGLLGVVMPTVRANPLAILAGALVCSLRPILSPRHVVPAPRPIPAETLPRPIRSQTPQPSSCSPRRQHVHQASQASLLHAPPRPPPKASLPLSSARLQLAPPRASRERFDPICLAQASYEAEPVSAVRRRST